MSEDEVGDLIRQLQDPQVRQQEITLRLSELVDHRAETQGNRATGRASPPPVERTAREGFEVGERVFITNNIRHVPFRRRANLRDRAAIAQRILNDRVHITTCNGCETWRHASNPRKLTDNEHENIINRRR